MREEQASRYRRAKSAPRGGRREEEIVIKSFKGFDVQSHRSSDSDKQQFMAHHDMVVPKSFDLSQETHCVFLVSLGSKYARGQRFEALLQWIAANFQSCSIVPTDYVYRLTLELRDNLRPHDALMKAIQAGRDYKTECKALVAKFAEKVDIEWKPLSKFAAKYQADVHRHLETMKKLYGSSRDFRHSVKGFTDQFVEKMKDTCPDTNLIRQAALTQLLEECAIGAAMTENNGPMTMMYAGRIDPFVDLIEGKFAQAPEPIINGWFHLVSVALKPQPNRSVASSATPKATGGKPTSVPKCCATFKDFLDSDAQKKLLRIAQKPRKGRDGEVLIEAGSVHNALLLLMEGNVEERMTLPGSDANERISVSTPGSLVGEMCFLDSKPSPVSVLALHEVTYRAIAKADFDQAARKDPSWALHVMSALAKSQSLRLRYNLREALRARIEGVDEASEPKGSTTVETPFVDLGALKKTTERSKSRSKPRQTSTLFEDGELPLELSPKRTHHRRHNE